MSTSINFFTSLEKDALTAKLEAIQTKYADMFDVEFGMTEAFDVDKGTKGYLRTRDIEMQVRSGFMAWPTRRNETYVVEDMIEDVKSEFKPDEVVALWDMGEIM